MNPYDSYQAIRDSVESLIGKVGSLKAAYDIKPEATSVLEDLQTRLGELQREHLRLWQLQKRSDYHLEFIVSKLECMDILCGQLTAQLDKLSIDPCSKSLRVRDSRCPGFKRCYFQPKRDQSLETIESVEEKLKLWLQSRTPMSDILTYQALGVSPRLKMLTRVGYEPLIRLSARVADLLENGQRKIVAIHGLPGIGKSSLAEYVASHPSERFCDGSVKMQIGQACSMAACGKTRDQYEKLLAFKLRALLSDIKNGKYEIASNASLQQIWLTVGEALRGSSFLIVLDDLWEKDVLHRFIQLQDNNCSYLVTCSTGFMKGAAEVNAVELKLEDVCQVSSAIFKFHSGCGTKQIIPDAAKKLIQHSSHHPLALAIQAEALRGVKVKEWGMAIDPLIRTLPALKLKLPNKSKLQLERIMFSSIEFSVSGMEKETKDLFNALAALSWQQSVPVGCLQALWVGLGWNKPFMLQARELIRRCLLQRTPDFSHFSLHPTISVFLETKLHTTVERLFKSSSLEVQASVAPWLFFFGKAEVKEPTILAFFNVLAMAEGDWQVKILLSTADVIKSSEIMEDSELEKFNKLVGREIIIFLSKAIKPKTFAAIARYLAVGFSACEFQAFSRELIDAGLIQKITPLLSSKLDLKLLVKNEVADVLAKMAKTKVDFVMDELLRGDVLKQLVLILDTKLDWIHNSAIDAIISLLEGGEPAVKQVIDAGLFETIASFLEDQRDFRKYRALKILRYLIKTGNVVVIEKLLASDFIQKMETFLQDSTEDLQIATANVYKQLIEVGSDKCMEQIFETRAVEGLCMMLQSDSEPIHVAAISVLRKMMQANGNSCAQRLSKTSAFDNMGEILQEDIEDRTSEEASICYELLSEQFLYCTDE